MAAIQLADFLQDDSFSDGEKFKAGFRTDLTDFVAECVFALSEGCNKINGLNINFHN